MYECVILCLSYYQFLMFVFSLPTCVLNVFRKANTNLFKYILNIFSIFFIQFNRALKEAALAQRVKEKAKKAKGGFFGFGGSKAPTKEEEEVDAEQDHDDKEEVHWMRWIFFILKKVHQFVLLMHFFGDVSVVFEIILPFFIYFFF